MELRSRITHPKIRRSLRGDLDNIVLKALRKEPERRYASVEQFAADIQRHLAGLPVSAAPDSVLYRLNKFVRRHSVGLAIFSLLMLAILAGTLATLYQARKAAANALLAEKRFADVRKLANSMLFEIHDSIQDLPGSVPARKLLVERALQYLDSLSRESSNDPSLQRELASAYKRVGDVQGYPYLSNVGDVRGAIESYHKALSIESSLVKKDPNNITDALDFATVYRRLSELDSVNNDMVDALAEGKQAVTIGEGLSARLPNDRKVLEGLFKDYQTLAGIEGGNASANLGDTAAALDLHKKVVEIAERLVVAEPNDATLQRLLASGVLRFGDQLIETGDRSKGESQYLRGEQILTKLAAPNNVMSQVDLAETYARLGSARLSDNDLSSAKKYFLDEFNIYKKLSTADPSDTNLRLGLDSAYTGLGDTASKLGRKQEAVAALQFATTIGDELAARSPTSEMLSNQGLVHVVQAEILDNSGSTDAALQHLHKAQAIYSKLVKDDPSNVDSQLYLAATYDRIGIALLHKNKIDLAENAYQSAINLVQVLKNPGDSNAQLLYVMADSYTGLGDVMRIRAAETQRPVQIQARNWQAALSLYEESLKIWHKIPEPGIESPAGFDSVPPDTVTHRSHQCRDALRRLRT
jgi:non-specific serine/threonine protein kinase/serine/threonine-protein kinase